MSPVPSATSPMPHPYGSSQYSIEELAFEEDGPRHAVLMIRGNFMCQQVGTTIPELMGPLHCPFTLRSSAGAVPNFSIDANTLLFSRY
ncbi:uncharacterized protein METZ01_LOCUS277359 [marine metagenome]|uniref:Uncharacterized protein n=1 Tax=marine metagenome TaxID=408172 RepID=A0A382KLQ5_9ZZZZ